MNQIKETAQAYTRGAVIGGILMAGFALITRRRVVLWTSIGAVAGGYVAYRLKESKIEGKKTTTNFKNYDL